MDWDPGPAKDSLLFQNTSFLRRHLQKTPTETENCFFDFDYKTCWIRRGFEQLFSSIAWRVIGLQSSTRKVAHAGLKGYAQLFTTGLNRDFYHLKSVHRRRSDLWKSFGCQWKKLITWFLLLVRHVFRRYKYGKILQLFYSFLNTYSEYM